jgi:hypothetical protein
MLKKLSLAALIAMGSLSVASATPLTDAIKNVNLSGYLRLRVYHETKAYDYANRYRTTALFKFAVPVNEQLTFKTAYAFDWDIYSVPNNSSLTSGSSTFNNVKFFLQYSANGLTALAGKIPVPTPVTATGVGEATAAGAIALYKVNNNVTVAGAALDDMVGDDQVQPNGNNTYALAGVVNYGPLAAQLWYFNVHNVLKHDYVLMASYKMADYGLTFNFDYANAKLDSNVVNSGASVSNDVVAAASVNEFELDKTQTYFNISAKYAMDQFCAKLGYAKTGKHGGIVTLDHDSPLASVLPTQQITGITDTTDHAAVYGKVGYMVDPKTSVYAAASLINDKSSANEDYNEYVVGGSYKCTKQMKVSAYYSYLKGRNGASNDKNGEARIEFKYSF